jgi:hypothetical protein
LFLKKPNGYIRNISVIQLSDRVYNVTFPGVTRSKKYTPISLLNYILHVNDDVWTIFLHRTLKSNILFWCKLFHKKDKWHNWSKLYYSWIKLTLITMYKPSFLYIKWNKIQLWKLVCGVTNIKLFFLGKWKIIFM